MLIWGATTIWQVRVDYQKITNMIFVKNTDFLWNFDSKQELKISKNKPV